MTMTAGTNTPATPWSASLDVTLGRLGVSTSRTIWARAVSAPILVARTVGAPLVLTVAPVTGSPSAFSTGTDSPVSMDSSTALAPATTSPSVGTFSPGRTLSRSPTATCSTGTMISWPSRSTLASLASSSSRARMAWPARPLARASKKRPRTRKAMMTAAASKYSLHPAGEQAGPLRTRRRPGSPWR